MAKHMNCPECEHPFGYSVALIGKTIRCRQCQHTFTVKAPPADASNPGSQPAAPAVGSAKPTPSTSPAAPPPMPAKVVANRDETRRTKNREAEDERQRQKEERERQRKADNRSKSLFDDEDDDRPPTRRERDRPPARSNRYSDRDDDDDRDRRDRGSDKGMLVGILLGTGVFVALIIGVMGYVLWPKRSKVDDPNVAVVTPPDMPPVFNPPPVRPNPILDPPVFNPPVFNPPVRPNPPPVRPNPPPIFNEDPARPLEPKTPKVPPKVAPPPKPNGLSAREEIELGGPVDGLAVGGGGKYLCLVVPSKDKVVIFDTEERKIAKELTGTGTGTVKIAAGKDTLHILNPLALTMERYKLGTFERDASHKFATARNVFSMAMGSDCEGPLVVVVHDNSIFNGGAIRYVDPKTYRDLNARIAGKNPAFGIGNKDKPPHVFVSNDGKVVMAHGLHHSEPVIDIYDGMRGVVRNNPPFGFRDFIKPSASGDVLFGKGCMYNVEFKTNDKPVSGTWLIPALDGDYYLSLAKPGDRDFGRHEGQPMLIDIWHVGSKQPMLGIGVLPEFLWKGEYDHNRHEGFHNNVFFTAKGKSLTLLAPDDNTRLVTYKVKLD